MGPAGLSYPGYEQFYTDLSTLISTYPPPFIYIQDMDALQTTITVVDALLRDCSEMPPLSSPFKVCYARVDTIACFTARLFYESVINTLAGWTPTWAEGCENWISDDEPRWNENLDTFLHGLRAVHAHLYTTHGLGPLTDKGKGKQREGGHDNVRLVIVVERAERLKETMPELLVPLTRLAELARVELSVIFISQVGWEYVRPPLGASPDPYYIDIPTPSKENVIQRLLMNFPILAGAHSTSNTSNPYHPSLNALYEHFITLLCGVCYPFTHDPQELQYIAAARWPGFVKPLLDEHDRRIAELRADADDDDDNMDADIPFEPPSEDVRMRLTRLFMPSLESALEALHPRLTNAADWALANEPDADLLDRGRLQKPARTAVLNEGRTGMQALPRMGKFILVAAFLASTNPPKSDVRMFGRGLDEKKRKRRATKATGKTRGGGPAKVPQRLLGPAAFALERMVAILGALLEENDMDDRLLPRHFGVPGEYTDMEISRVGVFSSIMELTSMRLLHRTSPPDRLDGPPMFKCAISYDATLGLAKELGVRLNDLLWDPL
ncbi:origin recognition complex subunit 5 C-terminus-domain-containing protein [Crassisporium funariophilum]|nr:origin recognition complex subunit 5 C-terminus-domain-containing protein [Crassisporium funariophilum]